MDSLAKMHGKKMLKQRLDFSLENKIETIHRFPEIQGQQIVETTVKFPFENKIETMDSLAKMHGQKNY